MSPDSSQERFFTVQEARQVIEHYSTDRVPSDDTLRRYCRNGKIAAEEFPGPPKRWVMTLQALVNAHLLPLEALDEYGESLPVPDSVPEAWSTDAPGPLERMLASQAALESVPTANGRDAEWLTGGNDEDNAPLSDVLDGPGDADLQPTREPAGGLAGSSRSTEATGPPTRAKRRPIRSATPLFRSRGLRGALAAIAAVSLGVGVLTATSISNAEPEAPRVATSAQLGAANAAARTQSIQRQLTAASSRGDLDRALTLAIAMDDQSAAADLKRRAVDVLLDRATEAVGDRKLRAAREALTRAKSDYGDLDPERAAGIYDRIHAIEKQQAAERAKKRAAAERKAAQRRAAQREAAAAAAARRQTPSGPTTPSNPAPSSRTAPSNPAPSNPAPSSGGGSGGSSSPSKGNDPGIY